MEPNIEDNQISREIVSNIITDFSADRWNKNQYEFHCGHVAHVLLNKKLEGWERAKLKLIEMVASQSYLNGEFVMTWSEKIQNLVMDVETKSE